MFAKRLSRLDPELPRADEPSSEQRIFVASVPLDMPSQQLKLSSDQVKYLCEEASRAGTQGQRAEIFACEVARASAGEL